MCPNAKAVSRQSPRVPERSHGSFWKGFHSLLWKWIVSLLWVSYPQQLVLWTLSFATVLGPYNGWNTRLHSTQISYFALESFARSPAALVSIVVVVICHVSWESENASSEQTANFGTPPPPPPSLSLLHTHVHLPLSPVNRMRFLWLSSPMKISKRAYCQFVQHFTCNIQRKRKTAKREKGRERGRGGGWRGGIHLGHCPSWRGRAGGCGWGGGENRKRERQTNRQRQRHTEKRRERDRQTKTERDERLIRYIPIISDITLKEKKKKRNKRKKGKKKRGGGGGGLRILFQFPLLYWTFVTYYMDTMTLISWR